MRIWMTTLAVLTITTLCCANLSAQGPTSSTVDLPRVIDRNRDGAISAQELAGATDALKRLDTNRDGTIDAEELSTLVLVPFQDATLAQDDDEAKLLAKLDVMYGERRGMMNAPPADGALFRLLTEAVDAKHVVEIGTSNGYSGIWFCMALKETGGKLTTFDIDEGRFKLAQKNFKEAGVDDIVTQVFGDAHENVLKLEGPIDILFLDADKEGYIDYLEKLLPKVKPGGLIIAHNMNARMADKNFVKAITTNKNLETLFLHKELGGVSVSMKKR